MNTPEQAENRQVRSPAPAESISGWAPEPRFSSGQSARDRYDDQPLHIALWQVLTGQVAFMLYIIIGLCWAAWRYVISRYA